MSAITVQQMADRVADLMHEKLGLRGKGLGAKLSRSGRLLPGYVRAEASVLAEAADKSRNARLQAQIDHQRVAHAYQVCVTHLRSIDVADRRWGAFLGWLSSMALQFLLIAAAVIGVLIWRGFL